MAFAATMIMKLLAKYPLISWLGLAVLIYVAIEMLYRGITNCDTGIGPLLGFLSDAQCVPSGKGGGH
jgi:predicted tellurium resistance membrane protein TerC